jgi:hypothetical protein
MYDQDDLLQLAFVVKEMLAVRVCESFSPCTIKIDVVEGTLLMISKLGIAAYCDESQIGYGTFRAIHFSPFFTTENELS